MDAILVNIKTRMIEHVISGIEKPFEVGEEYIGEAYVEGKFVSITYIITSKPFKTISNIETDYYEVVPIIKGKL